MSDSDKSDFYSSDDDLSRGFAISKKKITPAELVVSDRESDNDAGREDYDDDDDDDDDNQFKSVKKKASTFIDKVSNNNNDDDDDGDDDQYFGFLSNDEDEDEDEDEEREAGKNDNKDQKEKQKQQKTATKPEVKKLTAKQLAKEEAKVKKSGVVYLSSLPPYMKPQKLRQIMSKFGEIGRIFLKPEDPKVYKSRIKSGGNKKKKFDEGWVEFTNKSNAKLAAQTLNSNILGGKKGSFYHDDVMNVKYLKGFKWFDLTNALNKEIEVRDSKKQAELSQANKINKAFLKNVETSKTINRVKESKKRDPEDPEPIRRSFKQRHVSTNRADANSSIKNKYDNDSSRMVVDEKLSGRSKILSGRSKILSDRCLLLKLVDKINILDGGLNKVDELEIELVEVKEENR